jgi:3-oxoacyl-(acyl-carrier-protein) synthase
MQRKAEIYAELAGFGMTSDAGHITRPDIDGVTSAINKALHNAGLQPEDVDYMLAIYHGIIPPTANFTIADPLCDLDYVPNKSREKEINVAISNSFAFGGLNAVIALKKYSHS